MTILFRKPNFAAVALVGVMLAGSTVAQDALTRLDPNSATAAELAALDTLPDELADKILASRPFERTAGFDALVSATLSGELKTALYQQLFLPIELNTATEAEIGLIPGMSRRMIHEFEEYRPYTSIDQFNREIGKYVDTGEVARLRSYVTLGN